MGSVPNGIFYFCLVSRADPSGFFCGDIIPPSFSGITWPGRTGGAKRRPYAAKWLETTSFLLVKNPFNSSPDRRAGMQIKVLDYLGVSDFSA